MSNPDLKPGALAKPKKGVADLKRKATKRARKTVEEKTMLKAKQLDGYKCRRIRCPYKELRVEAAHKDHRGMGGNPDGSRTKLEELITLCIRDHQDWDHGELEIVELDPKRGLRGPCSYYSVDLKTGRRTLIGFEIAPGREAKPRDAFKRMGVTA